LRSDPKSLEADLGLGRGYYALGEYTQAEASFESALQLQSSDSAILNWLGRCYLQERQPQKVLELVNHAGSSTANSALIHLLLGHTYEAQDKLDEAAHEIQRALTLDPHCHGAHFAQGFIAWSIGNLADAECELQQELDLDPHEILAAYYLADALEKQGNIEAAEVVLTQMGHDAPNTYLYHLGVGKVQEQKKNYSLAEEHYQQAIRLAPQQQEVHFRLAVVLRAQGKTAEAHEEFQAFTQLQTQSKCGVGQGMGRMRQHIPDFD
jgi:tetratricopeptide (TPR) repeat protein